MSDRKAPIIGSFSGPEGNTPRSSAPLQRKGSEATPSKQVEEELDDIEEEGEEEPEQDGPETSEQVAKRYLAGLSERGISLDEARRIQDTLLVDLAYSEEVKLSSNVSIEIRTRIYRDVERALRLIENEAPQLPMHVDDLLARYNVAASLARYNNTKFDFPQLSPNPTDGEIAAAETAFHARLSFLMSLPTNVVGKLIDAVAEFDSKLSAVLAKGAPEDF